MEEKWKEMKHAIMESATQRLQRKWQVRRWWISEDTLKIIKAKHQAFQRWQEERTNVVRRREYTNCCKKVRKAVKEDREKWLNEMMKEMEEHLTQHRQGNVKENEATDWQQSRTIWHDLGRDKQTATQSR